MVNPMAFELMKKPKRAKESAVEKHLVRRVKELGGEVRKVKWIGRRAAPDRLVLLPSKMVQDGDALVLAGTLGISTESVLHNQYVPAKSIWVELKRPGGLATFPKNAHERAQLREHERMRSMGQRVVVIDSIEGVEELLR